jgi:hypothetical protein
VAYDLVVLVEIDVKDLRDFADQLFFVVAARFQNVNRGQDIDALGQAPLGAVVNGMQHRFPLARMSEIKRQTLYAMKMVAVACAGLAAPAEHSACDFSDYVP